MPCQPAFGEPPGEACRERGKIPPRTRRENRELPACTRRPSDGNVAALLRLATFVAITLKEIRRLVQVPTHGRVRLRDYNPGWTGHGDQGNAANGGEMLDERSDQRFDALIRPERHLDPPRVLQARRKEVDLRLCPILIGDPDRAEVVL
jgi:hypothetical protein